MGATSWEKSSNGPDWTDVLITMKAIEDLHSVSVTFTLVPGVFAGPAGMLTIAARSVSTDASLLGSYVAAISGEWPCERHDDLAACAYAGLISLDFDLDKKLLKQKTLT
jgi:hypothetical protein